MLTIPNYTVHTSQGGHDVLLLCTAIRSEAYALAAFEADLTDAPVFVVETVQ